MQNLQKRGTDMKSILSIPPFASISSSSSSSSSVVARASSSFEEKSGVEQVSRARQGNSGDCVARILGVVVLETATDVRPTALKAQLQVNEAITVHINRSNLVVAVAMVKLVLFVRSERSFV
jgi:hypothetical protein